MKILFIGDSTTDMWRGREANQPYSLGMGHVFMIAEELLQKDPSIEIINRGNGGNRITDINERFEKDCLDINPDIVTIMFGVNDLWHAFSGIVKLISLKKWTEIYQSFIDRIKKNNKNAKIILMPPFIIHGKESDLLWDKFQIIKKYQRRVKKIAKDNGLYFIDSQKVLDKASLKYGNENVLYDGVHPNILGAKALANAWIKTYKNINK